MAEPIVTLRHLFEPESNIRLSRLCGPLDAHLRRLEEALGLSVARRGASFQIDGPEAACRVGLALLQSLYAQAHKPVYEEAVELALAEAVAQLKAEVQAHPDRPKPSTANVEGDSGAKVQRRAPRTAGRAPASTVVPTATAPASASNPGAAQSTEPDAESPVLQTRRSELRGRSPHQVQYLQQMLAQDITFGIGPAGTGKTFLAVACAVDALDRQSVQRVVLTRPAVEAGERLGFLPGDLAQKVDPYLRPLYDALYELMGLERVNKAFDRGLIEIAPLAFMRGRTLNHAFVILDEAQNTTREQMKMFLTRMGFGSRCVVTGDVSQIDLPPGTPSGLVEAEQVLASVKGIGITRFTADDVVRHPLVARIVEAYEAAGTQQPRPAV